MSEYISGGHAPYKPLEWPILWGCQTPLRPQLPTTLPMFKRVKKINQCQCLFPFEANKVHTVWPCPTEHHFVPSHSRPLRCPPWPPSSPTCQSQGGVWRLVETGLPDSTRLRPAWPILWYLTTRLQDTCSFELKCHWGILSAHRHLGLTSDFTLVCYKAENTGPWPWRTQTVSYCQHGYFKMVYRPGPKTGNDTKTKQMAEWPIC